MRRVALLIAMILVALGSPPALAWHHHPGVFIGVGPLWWPYAYPYPYWAYPPGYVYSPPPLVVEEPPVYVQQQPPAPPDGPYWYYCASARAYFPTAATCPEPWVKVPPRPE